MSDLYKFDINTQPITMYEWDDGGWEREFLRSSETLSANLDGTITLTKARGQLLKQTVYSPMAKTKRPSPAASCNSSSHSPPHS